MTNEEMLLMALNGATLNGEFQPQNNMQAYLAYAVGLITDPAALPAPRTNEEALMMNVALNGSGSGSYDGELPTLTNPAAASEILAGKEVIAQNGTIRVGTLETEEKTVTPTAKEQWVVPTSGKLMSKVVVNGDGNLLPMNIKKDVTVFGVTGTCEAGGGTMPKLTHAGYMFYSSFRNNDYDEVIEMCSGATQMAHMFNANKFIDTVDLTNLDTSKCTDMSNMFRDCQANYLVWGTSGTSKVDTMADMFRGSYFKELDLSKLDTSAVTDMSNMFYQMNFIESLDFTSLNVNKVTKANSMFYRNASLKEIVGIGFPSASGFNISLYGSASNPLPFNRLVFRQVESGVAIRSYIMVSYCSFERSGMVEMFNSLPDLTSLGITAPKITITGNPCITGTLSDGTTCETLTDEDRLIATNKGWQIIE